ncbi:MAG: prephenate dehydrogenase [Gemmatimonadota bacterium]|nr:prephenate dehydrogenase [Gemmatimonadota bacterium]
MTEIRCAAVIGLGLIGGSLARDLAARGVQVLGWDEDPGTLREAAGAGAIHAALDPALEGVTEAEVVVIAVPVGRARVVLEHAAPRLGRARLVTDVGSTKRSVVAAAERLGLGERFVGSHPLAGDHRSGWGASRTELFSGARVFLCPASGASDDALALAPSLWSAVGARPETIGAAEHDRTLAWSSHLPQALSSALARALAAAAVGSEDLGPGGRDATRLAASSPGTWTEIALDNADNLAEALAAAEGELRALRTALESADGAGVHRFFAGAQRWSLG